MRKIYIFLSIALLFITATNSLSAQKTIKEATLTWAVTQSNATSDQGAQALEMMKSLEMKWTFNESKMLGNMTMGSMMDTKFVVDKKNDSRKVFMSMMGQKFKADLKEDQFSNMVGNMQNQGGNDFTIKKDQTKTILGYNCYLITSEFTQRGMKGTINVYITEDINIEDAEGLFNQNAFVDTEGNQVKGFPLSMNYQFPGFTYTMQVIELKETFSPHLVEVPKGEEYKAMDPSMLKQFSGQ